jgi:hypothetical protein
MSGYDDLAGEKVHRAQNTIAAYANILANSVQSLVYKLEQSRDGSGA